MKKVLYITIIGLVMIACTKDFEEMNQDPFSPTGTTVEALFNGVVSSLQQSMNEQFYLQNEIWYPETELGALTSNAWGNSQIGTSAVWSDYYLMLSNIRELERRFETYNTEQGDTAICDKVRAQLNILKAYQTFKVTDIFGDMPYSQAGRIWENAASQQTMKPSGTPRRASISRCWKNLSGRAMCFMPTRPPLPAATNTTSCRTRCCSTTTTPFGPSLPTR